MSSRNDILRNLRAARQPVTGDRPAAEWRHMVPVSDTSRAALQARFVRAAETLGCSVTCVTETDQAITHILALIAPDKLIQSWSFEHIPLPGLSGALAREAIEVVPGAAAARVGLTGADAALAGTGGLMLVAGPGKPRKAALLPPVHIAVITTNQIVADLETWITSQRPGDFQRIRTASNSVMISGPSRTADIANILVKGVHGPGAMHIVLVAPGC